jgi:cell division protein FtsL
MYILAGTVVALLICYLALAAQVTQESYEISRLQNQRVDLQAEQAQLRYQKASLESPSHVDASAGAAGLQRKTPARYVAYQPTALDVAAPVGDPSPDRTPLWQRALAGIFGATGGREAAASDR